MSGFQKSHSFSCMTIRNARTCVSKSDVITLPVFWPLYSKKIKILLWIFLSGLCVCMLITHILFLWISWKIWIMCATIYEKWNFEFGGTKSEISQTWYVLYVELAMFGVFRLRFISELKILAAFQHLPFFLPKMAKHDVTKTQFSQKNFSTEFSELWRQTSNSCWGRY